MADWQARYLARLGRDAPDLLAPDLLAPDLLAPDLLAPDATARTEAACTEAARTAARAAAMNAVNPAYIPRNHLVEAALTAAAQGDMAPFERLLAVLSDPYTEVAGQETFAAPAPSGAGRYRTFCGT